MTMLKNFRGHAPSIGWPESVNMAELAEVPVIPQLRTA
jgi:hypothetical protein